MVTVQPGAELYSQNRENKKSFGAIYPPKDFFYSILVIDFEIVYKFFELYAFFKIFFEISTFLFTEHHKNIQVIHRHYDECKNPCIRKKQFIMLL